MTDRSAIHSTFVIERTYAASPARVFAAFEDPESKNRWFVNGDGWGTENYQADFRVGGYEKYRGKHEGMTVSMESRYFDIVPNERIVFAYATRVHRARHLPRRPRSCRSTRRGIAATPGSTGRRRLTRTRRRHSPRSNEDTRWRVTPNIDAIASIV